MPLVTRLANQGIFYKQATQPSDWQNGDIWIDTDDSNVYVNQGGTAVRIALGSLTRGDVLYASADDTIQRLAKGVSGQYLQIGANDPSWVTLTSPLEVLDNHEASGNESTYTYTPGTALDFDTYSKIIVVIDVKVNAALALLMRLNSSANALYTYAGHRQTTTATTTISANSQTSQSIASATILSDDNGVVGEVSIMNTQNETQGERLAGFSKFEQVGGTMANESLGWMLDEAHSTITAITILTSTSTWKAGSRITVYGMKRA